MSKEKNNGIVEKNNDDDKGEFTYPRHGGYYLNSDGLSNIVSQKQMGILDVLSSSNHANHPSINECNAIKILANEIGCIDIKNGLPTRDGSDVISQQRKKYGTNELPLPPEPSMIDMIIEQLQDPTIIMLLISSIVSLILGLVIEQDYETGWIEGTSIIVTVCLVVSVATLTDYAKASEFRNQQIQLENEKYVHVIRNHNGNGTNGSASTNAAKNTTVLSNNIDNGKIHPKNLVVGDIIRLAIGDIVPVDGILIDCSSDLKMDESSITGESDLIEKSLSVDPFIVSGTNVMQGTGKLLVLAVGKYSIQGKILIRLREQEENDKDSENDGDSNEKKSLSQHVKEFFTFGISDDGADLVTKLDTLAMDIGKVGIIISVIVFFVMLLTWYYNNSISIFALKEKDFSTILNFFITAITILVVAVPEGLPLAVTLSLAISSKRMIKDNNQVKHIDSCETMGSTTTICSDKTGTLTENKMTVMKLLVGNPSDTDTNEYEYIVGSNKEENHLGDVITAKSNNNTVLKQLLCESVVLNCNPTSNVITTKDPTNDSIDVVKYVGNATECALIKLTQQLQYKDNMEAIRSSYKEDDEKNTLDWGVYAIPFSSERKRMSSIVRRGKEAAAARRLYSKGAPQQMFDACTSYVHDINSSIVVKKLSKDVQLQFESKVEQYQNLGLRTLALAYRDFAKPMLWDVEGSTNLESSLTLIGILGIEDPLRSTVPDAISKCRKAGVDVRMCTGDALSTAISIAKGCGILQKSDINENDGMPKANFAMTGAEFDDRVHLKDPSKPKIIRRVFDPAVNDAVDKLAVPFLLDRNGNKVLDQEEFDQIWPTLRVLARCQPEDKLTLVRGMRKSRVFMDTERCDQLRTEHNIHIFPDFQVVAVTGDGTNDAPALKSANVGFAMGIVGTETAKQACDIILLDDNFASTVQAVMWGRNVFDSISKFLQFQLTVNIVAISLAVIGAFVYSESPLSAVQMLWVNMIMDSLASLALATELPTKELLDRAPYGKRRPIISNIMTANMIGQASYQITILCWVLLAPQTLPMIEPPIEYDAHQGSLHWSLFFNVFVMLQLFNEFNCRRLQTVDKLKTTWSEWNVFHGAWSNKMFVFVMITTFVLQVFIVQYGGLAVNLMPGGLTSAQWTFSVCAGAFSLIWQLFINVFITLFFGVPKKEAALTSKKTTASISPKKGVVVSTPNKDNNETKDAAGGTKGTSRPRLSKKWASVKKTIQKGAMYSQAFGTDMETGMKMGAYEIRSAVERSAKHANTREAERQKERMSLLVAKDILKKKVE